jgi:hypothetical protein
MSSDPVGSEAEGVAGAAFVGAGLEATISTLLEPAGADDSRDTTGQTNVLVAGGALAKRRTVGPAKGRYGRELSEVPQARPAGKKRSNPIMPAIARTSSLPTCTRPAPEGTAVRAYSILVIIGQAGANFSTNAPLNRPSGLLSLGRKGLGRDLAEHPAHFAP